MNSWTFKYFDKNIKAKEDKTLGQEGLSNIGQNSSHFYNNSSNFHHKYQLEKFIYIFL